MNNFLETNKNLAVNKKENKTNGISKKIHVFGKKIQFTLSICNT